jgi:hypothetical protein
MATDVADQVQPLYNNPLTENGEVVFTFVPTNLYLVFLQDLGGSKIYEFQRMTAG